METETFLAQQAHLPESGRAVVASFDATTITVYQAYRPSIAAWALEHGRFGGPDFSLDRMSWIKPSFLWMMYRSGWATKAGQEHVLAVRLRRTFFDRLAHDAVASTFDPSAAASRANWQAALATSEVRVQWDPDRSPRGAALERRAIQLGLRGARLCRYATDEIVDLRDVTAFVHEQRETLASASADTVLIPVQRLYPAAKP